MTRRRIAGSTIVVALLITVVLVTVAVSLLRARLGQRSVANARFGEAKAEMLAWAGLEDARVKLMNSRNFPPTGTFGSTSFSYSGQLRDPSGVVVGTYFVEVDLAQKDKAVIRSSARLADQSEPSLMMRGELDTEPERKAYLMDGSETTETRPFLWMRTEIYDVWTKSEPIATP